MARRGENIYHRKDGRWEGRYRSGFSESGKPRYRSVYGRSYAEVKHRLMPLKAAPESGKAVCRLTIKVLFEEWLTAVKLRVKASTFANYQAKVERHLLPGFGAVRYDELTVQMINDFIRRKLDQGLSAKYVSDIIIVFKTMAKYAAKIHDFRNILADVALPKVQRKEPLLLTKIQQALLCKTLRSGMNTTSVCILLSLYTGLRVGEVCGLMWGDINFEKSTLTVRRTVQRIRTGSQTALIVDSPKSCSSQRCIPVPGMMMEMLRKFRSRSEHYILSGSRNITEPRTLQRRFKSVLKKAHLPSVTYHSLRHAFATNCLQAGFDVKTLSEILGHASALTTLNRYVHSSMERKISCMALLEQSAKKVFPPSETWSVYNEFSPVSSQSQRL